MMKDNAPWLIDTARAIFNTMQEMQAEAKANGERFKDQIERHDDDVWTEALRHRSNGCVTAQLSVVRVNVLKNTFGANFTKHKEAGFDDAEDYKQAQNIAIEQFLREKNKVFLKKLTDAVFSKADDGAIHKETLRSILLTTEISELLDGGAGEQIQDWFAKPWLMPGVAAWFKILWKYEGINESVDGDFLNIFNETAALGEGPQPENINEINRKLEMILKPATKAFATVENMCDHLRVCALVSIIKRWARGTTRRAQAWTLADNYIVASMKANTPISLGMVTHAISLAQKHIEREGETPEAQALTTSDESAEMAALKLQLAEAQKSITALQANTQPAPTKPSNGEFKRKRGGGAGGAGGAAKGGKPERKRCTICKKMHPGDPPESECYERDLEGEMKTLQELVKKKEAFKSKEKGETEQKWKARVHFIENKAAQECFVSLSSWHQSMLSASEFQPVTLDVCNGACVDSGSPVDITSSDDEANLTLGPDVRLGGITRGEVMASPAACRIQSAL